jgi:hypothetical protein
LEPCNIVIGDLHVLVHKECMDNIGCQNCLKGEKGVTTLGCRNASNAVAREEGCGRKVTAEGEEYSYKIECNV